ncbi:hypothetical protein [Actinacidiphila acidipaludis]|uniref:Uncharacterized protein n=1 Tax=Actinacidiphila acidipaludis TaxID=2873382 RepID=A0ABS7QC17_9ACTN|nr:hypothetical protein [Streptomyces acidipaludis]MBY8880691.1 hypothetical protein [Streptomyces acidipaludis]
MPLAIIAVISVVDMMSSTSVHLGPLVALAPAVTAAFAGPQMTAFVGLVAIAADRDEPAELINCGHPPPLLIRRNHV